MGTATAGKAKPVRTALALRFAVVAASFTTGHWHGSLAAGKFS